MRPRPIAVSMLWLVALAARADEPLNPAAPRAEDVFSEAEGDRAVVYIAPEGARVAKGQVVCVLDAIAEPDGLKDRRITATEAEASYQQAKLTREVAEVALIEYEEGSFHLDVQIAEDEITVAESNLKRAEDRLQWMRKVLERNPPRYAGGGSQITSDKFNVDKARYVLEQARAKKAVLLKLSKDKTLKGLRAEVVKARADERAKKATLDLERSKVKGIERQAGARVVLAPADGTVRLARPSRLVEVGAEVCKDQLLLRIVPPGK